MTEVRGLDISGEVGVEGVVGSSYTREALFSSITSIAVCVVDIEGA